jgi:sugar O-acyltransferase (sialic acid O-acetyltransferase NeuD family)
MSQPLVILGAGGGAHDVLDTVEAVNAVRPAWRVVGFLDDARPAGGLHLGLPVLGKVGEAARFPGHRFINVIGSDRSYLRRPDVVASAALPPERFATLVHPAASVSARARLGRGVHVAYGVSVGGGAVVGDHVCLCPGALVGHDTVLEDYALVGPGAVVSGFARLGRTTYVGARAVIRQSLRVGERALVGMGAVVVREVAEGGTVVGNPARPLARRGAGPPPA